MDEIEYNNYGHPNVKRITDELIAKFQEIIAEGTGQKPMKLSDILATGNYEGKRSAKLNPKRNLPSVPDSDLQGIVTPLPDVNTVVKDHYEEYNLLIKEIEAYEDHLKAISKSMRLSECMNSGNYDGKYKLEKTANQFIPRQFEKSEPATNLAMGETLSNNYGYKNVKNITDDLVARFENIINASRDQKTMKLSDVMTTGNYEGKQKISPNSSMNLPEISKASLSEIELPLPDVNQLVAKTFCQYSTIINDIKSYERVLATSAKSMKLSSVLDSGNYDGSKNKFDIQKLDTQLAADKSMNFEDYDTTSVACSLVLNVIGINEDVQQKVLNELRVYCNGPTGVTLIEAKSLKYLELVILETLRMFPPIPIITRTLSGDPSSIAMVSSSKIHGNPRIFPNPQTFNPDNFLPENIRKRPIINYLPLHGTPAAINSQLGKLKLIIGTILRNFKVKSMISKAEFTHNPNIIWSHENGFKIKIESR